MDTGNGAGKHRAHHLFPAPRSGSGISNDAQDASHEVASTVARSFFLNLGLGLSVLIFGCQQAVETRAPPPPNHLRLSGSIVRRGSLHSFAYDVIFTIHGTEIPDKANESKALGTMLILRSSHANGEGIFDRSSLNRMMIRKTILTGTRRTKRPRYFLTRVITRSSWQGWKRSRVLVEKLSTDFCMIDGYDNTATRWQNMRLGNQNTAVTLSVVGDERRGLCGS
jgi:hypothetical protein